MLIKYKLEAVLIVWFFPPHSRTVPEFLDQLASLSAQLQNNSPNVSRRFFGILRNIVRTIATDD